MDDTITKITTVDNIPTVDTLIPSEEQQQVIDHVLCGRNVVVDAVAWVPPLTAMLAME